ncbi:C-type natriuretic peptide 2 [Trichomycterus rosablanca]|uniref:C-type natriuretic peptide 2 n=1 Tax=Trichomycterus rosablanca TaxID=2290929 RepID=UPI002F354090
MASSSHLFRLWLILLVAMVTQVTSRPSSRRPDSQVLQDLFGSQLTSLLLVQPDVSEGSAQSPARSPAEVPALPGRSTEVNIRPFLDFLTRQRRFRGRSRKGSGRGCFGMKMDRIGALSGLGC